MRTSLLFKSGLIARSKDLEFKPISLVIGLTVNKPFVFVQLTHAIVDEIFDLSDGSPAGHTKKSINNPIGSS